MAKRYVCERCNKGCKYGTVHTCQQTCDCMLIPPRISTGPRISCDLCNRHFRSQICFDNQKKKTQGKIRAHVSVVSVDICGALITFRMHECNKRFCVTCNENKEVGDLFFLRPLVNVAASSEYVLYVFYDFETTQDTKRSHKSNEHVPNLVGLGQFCSKCENISDIEQDCIQCGKRIHSFGDDPVGDMLSYLCESRPWVEKMIVIAHYGKAFDLHFILNRAFLVKWQVELIMNGIKIMCVRAGHLVFIDSISFLPFALSCPKRSG